MKTLRLLAIAIQATFLFVGMCVTGGASEWNTKFGVAPIFQYERENTGIRITQTTATETQAKAATGRLRVQILLFEFESKAKDVDIVIPKKASGQ